jgi:hypothetical protein
LMIYLLNRGMMDLSRTALVLRALDVENIPVMTL